MVFIVVTYTGVVAVLIYLVETTDATDEDFTALYHKGLGYAYLATFILLALANVYMIVQLRSMTRAMGQSSSTFFRKEKLSLILTFVAFDLWYLVRFIWLEWVWWAHTDY